LGITESNSNIAHFAHLGGMLFGFILLKYWEKTTKKFY
jgi:membrane associated rhomboid family serine protease